MPSSSTQPSSTKSLVVGRAAYRQSSPGTSPDVITFQYNSTCVFVKLAPTHEQAVDIAQKEFDELANISRERIGFSLDDINHGGRHVRISDSAWSAITPKLSRGTIINIVLRPEVDPKIPPPQYLEVPGPDISEKDPQQHRQGSVSPPMSRSSSRASVRKSKSHSKLFAWMGSTSTEK